MRIKTLATIAVFALATSAYAGFAESEPNDTAPLADPIALTCNPPSADIGFGVLVNPAGGGGDVDLYSVFVPSGCILTAITTPYGGIPGNLNVPDTLLAVLTPGGGGVIVENDDAGSDSPAAGIARGSAVRFYNAGASDTFLLRVRGFGTIPSEGPYALTVSLFPEPATIGLLLGGLAMAARRRK